MKINHNMSAVVANNNLMANEDRLTTSLERLSSGLKLNQAKDSPTGMAISIKMQSQIDGLDQASNNAQDGNSLLQTADGALNEVTSMLQRIRELSVQAANGTNSVSDRESIQEEIDSLLEEIDRISKDTEYNSMTLFDGSLDRRVYTDNNKVEVVDVTEYVKSGKYTIEVTKDAKPAEVAGSGAAIDITSNAAPSPAVSGTITINDVDVEVYETDTQAEIYEKIRTASQQAGVDAVVDNGDIIFSSKEYGFDVELNISCSQSIAEYLGLDSQSITVTGSDAQVSLVDGFTATATATCKGQLVTISDRDGFELTAVIDNVGDGEEVVLDVTDMGTMTLQIGANKGQTMEVKIPEVSVFSLGLTNLNVCNEAGAGRALDKLDDAISKVSAVRSAIGAYENRLDHTISSLDQAGENMTTALSRIQDVDMAEEMSTYTNLQVLTQAGTSVLAQANELPQQALQMLQ